MSCDLENTLKKTTPQGSKRAFAEPRLETTAKSVRHFSQKTHVYKEKEDGRSSRFRLQRHAAKLLCGKGRVGLCRWSVVSKSKGVDVVSSKYAGEAQRVHFEGLQTCGSVWSCPCCGARISETRRDELSELLRYARSKGLTVNMITLTARHGRNDDLLDLLNKMKDAKRRWARHRSYRAIKLQTIGSVTATEVTGGGAHGWHPHFHVIIVTEKGVNLKPLESAWLASLRGAGLEGTGSGYDVRNADEFGKYIAKWGAAEELALTGYKKGRSGRTPAQLLSASCDEADSRAGALWSEYSSVFKGRRQLVWSRGLKALVGIGEVDDTEAAEDKTQDDQVEVERANIDHQMWKQNIAVRDKDMRYTIMKRAEDIGVQSAIDELHECHDIEDDDIIEEVWQPPIGGLASAALAAVRKPIENGFSP